MTDNIWPDTVSVFDRSIGIASRHFVRHS